MGSSGIVDSGRFAGQKSNFNQTCSLLTQYLKEKRNNLGDLDFGFNRNFDSNDTASRTMNLLPMIEKSGLMPEIQETAEPVPEKAQMTIFYAGQVMVFDDFPADKAEEIMLLASRGIPLNSNTPPASVAPRASFGTNMVQENHTHKTISTKISDVPIARKNSLTRFLEKRKDRITAKAPYQMSNKGHATSNPAAENNPSKAPYQMSNKGQATSKPSAENNPWLGLAAADRHT